MKNFWFEGDYRKTFIYDLFESWHKILCKYEHEISKKMNDLPYYYIERTNIGLLAAAGLKIGAFPIEEYSTSKGKGAARYTGRADLWLQAENGKTYDLEAKQKWVSLNSKKIAKIIKRPLKKAFKEAKELTDKSDLSIGIVFVVPYLYNPNEIDFSSFKKQILDVDSNIWNFVAIHFSDERIWKKIKIKNTFYPGIAVVGKYV